MRLQFCLLIQIEPKSNGSQVFLGFTKVKQRETVLLIKLWPGVTIVRVKLPFRNNETFK